MDHHDSRWLELLDLFTAWGQASAAIDAPLPTDDEVWAQARARIPELAEQPDRVLLVDLRKAFNEGRRPHRVDLRAVAEAITARGYHAFVDHTGGNTATLYAGWQAPDRHGEPRWSISAGPGWFRRPGHRDPVADTSELRIGPHADSWTVGVPEETSTRQVTDIAVAVIDEVEAQRTRFAVAARTARDALWAAFVACYPEIPSGDIAPGAEQAFVVECNKVLAGWLQDNITDPHRPPAHLAALAGDCAAPTIAPGGGGGDGEPR